ncbi:hypothetical protein Ade02nite_42250 [Paractinoplanes deccanensis]|uniref:Bacterial CdiA-CT RNAse A domain-containing protein n=1 Tax=Paractinoplanes deccanensis TaxID=113561 RepID=A0ABQ3Y6G9_9ACTN|nr:hypothetical protein [Actinoplanes deccanensis]GID75584.1 hypothetical protein Ade02nite_42250 [Actinoplanes deccanensis]
MTGKPKPSGSGGDPPPPPRGPRSPGPGDMDGAHDAVAAVAQAGRPGSGSSTTTTRAQGDRTPDDPELAEIMRRYEQLGDEPPRFDIAANDLAHQRAHTLDHHGPSIPLRRGDGPRTIEGRIYGDGEWNEAVNASLRWTDPSTMHREINGYIRENWSRIRDDLAMDRSHDGLFDAGHRVGEGYYNKGMYGVGPREATYVTTSLVRIRIKLVQGSDPAQPFILTAFPAALGS